MLRIHHVHVQCSRVLDCGLDRGLGDLVEYDALRGLHRQLEERADVPGDALALAVVVRGQDDLATVGAGDERLDLADLWLFGCDGREGRFKIIRDINIVQ